LQPTDVISLSAKPRKDNYYFYLFFRALTTINAPSSPIPLHARSSSLIVLESISTFSSAFIPAFPISFFLRASTSRYFLSYKAFPRATAPSAKIPLFDSHISVIYFAF